MMQILDVFKGGWDIDRATNESDIYERLAMSQRPADGHAKAAEWEDTTILTKDSLPCAANELEVGDIIVIHTTPTLGYVTGYGIAVESGVPGLKMKVASGLDGFSLSNLKFRKSVFREQENNNYSGQMGYFDINDAQISSEEFGDEPVWLGGVTDLLSDGATGNTDIIYLEIKQLPDSGSIEGLRLVSRMQYRQPVRPPAYLNCCGSGESPYAVEPMPMQT